MRKPEIERPGTNGSGVVSAPWNNSSRLPTGSLTTIRSATRRSSASAREPRATGTPRLLQPGRQRLKAGRVRDLPAEEADALAAIGVDDDPLLAIVHAERDRRPALVDALQPQEAAAVGAPIAQILGADTEIAQRLRAHDEPRAEPICLIFARGGLERKKRKEVLWLQRITRIHEWAGGTRPGWA